jgi:hypothetical protein
MVQRADETFCLYMFRDTRTQYDFFVGDDNGGGDGGGGCGGALLHLFCSLQKSNSHDLFYRGFLNALHDIFNNCVGGKMFRFLMVDDICDNGYIVDEFPVSAFLEKVDVNYYAYNLVLPTVTNALLVV